MPSALFTAKKSSWMIAALAALILLASCAETKANLSISGTFPATGTIGTPYSATLTAKGGDGTNAWIVTGLPPGVSAPATSGSTLTVSGTPTTPGTYSVSAMVTDIHGESTTYSSFVVINSIALSISPNSLGNFTVAQTFEGITYTATPATTGPYTWTITSGALPVGMRFTSNDMASSRSGSSKPVSVGMANPRTIQTESNSVTISGNPNFSGAYFFTLAVSDSLTPTPDNGSQAFSGLIAANTTDCAGVPLARGNESALSGPYAFVAQGVDGDVLPIAYAGSFTANTLGGITASTVDFFGETAGAESFKVNLAYSSYSFGADNRGCLYLVFQPAATATASRVPRKVLPGLAASAAGRKSTARPAGMKTPPVNIAVTLSFALSPDTGSGRIIEFDQGSGDDAGATGVIHSQSRSAFSVASLAPSFVFGMSGWYTVDAELLDSTALAGSFSNSAGVVSNGSSDGNIAGNSTGQLTGGTGTLGPIDPNTGRGIGTYSVDVSGTTLEFDYAYYVLNSSDYLIISTDSPGDVGAFSITGRAVGGSAVASPMNGYYMAGWSGIDLEAATSASGGNYAAIATLQAGTDGTVSSFNSIANDAGTEQSVESSGTYILQPSTSRVQFAGWAAPPVVYLAAGGQDDQIAGFLVGSDPFTSSGLLALQTSSSADFSDASLQGNFILGSAEDVVPQNASIAGVSSFDGEGNYTDTRDVVADDDYSSAANYTTQYHVGSDGTGFLGHKDIFLVTNGGMIFAIDSDESNAPALYILLAQ